MIAPARLRTRLMAATTALMAGFPLVSATAGADDTAELEARIAALEAIVRSLQDELDSQRTAVSPQADTVATLAPASVADTGYTAPPPTPAANQATAPASGFMAGHTRIGMGGFLDVDAHVTDLSDGTIAPTSIARDFYIPGAIPVGGNGHGDPVTDFTAKASRIYFTFATPAAEGDVTGRLEFDFLGSPGGNERVSNSYNPRLRVGWVDYRGIRAGQDWSTFQNTSAIPESVSFLVASDGMILVRQAQLRYTHGPWQLALENPDTTLTPAGGGARIENGNGRLPDLVVRYNRSSPMGNVSLAGLVRELSWNDGTGAQTTTGWGLSASGRIDLARRSDVRFTATWGEGVGRYIGLNAVNGATIGPDGSLEALPVAGGLVALHHGFGDSSRINLGLSYLSADNPVWAGPSATQSVRSGFANYMTDLAPGVSAGIEILYGERELENGLTGTLSRITLSTKYGF